MIDKSSVVIMGKEIATGWKAEFIFGLIIGAIFCVCLFVGMKFAG